MHFSRSALFGLLSVLCSLTTLAQTTPSTFLQLNARQNCWVDSVFTNMAPEDRIAQLIMVAGYSNRKPVYEDSLLRLVQTNKLGGVVMFQGGPVRQAQLTNRLQAASAVPLLIAMDAEWGIAMRLDSTVRYPYQMTLGAMQGKDSDSLIYRMGANLARQMRRLGMHVNFAPSADVNNNPNNPVINFRSFGENKYDVSRKALAYMRGMQDNRLLTSIKHFPGHGDTGTDSHYDLPLITKNRAQLDSLELYPFRELIKAGAAGVMVAHLSIPALDTTRNRPSTLSPAIVTNLLKNELGFQGLIFSDAMNMKGVTKYFPSGKADELGLEAGMDMLEFTEDVPAALAQVKQAIADGRITQASIDARCLKVLRAKAWVGLDQYKPIVLDNLVADLNPAQDELLNRQLTESSLTVLKNDRNLLPLKQLDTLRIASVAVESDKLTAFQQMAGNYTQIEHFNITSRTPDSTVAAVFDSLKNYNLLLVDVHLNNIRPGAKYGLQAKTAAMVSELVATGKAVVTVFGNAYALDKLTVDTAQPNRSVEQARAIVMPYQLTNYTEELSAQLIFGAIGASGKMPVTVNQRFRVGDGIPVQPIGRMKYTIPEEVGIDGRFLTRQVDSLVNVGISQGAFPGCVVQMARNGKVIFQKAYGKHTYDASLGAEPKPVQLDDLYDMASVTKVSTSTPALMRLVDEGKFNLDGKMADYLPFLRKSNKADLVWRDVLTHQARLKAWIPFWMDTKNPDGSWKPKTFKTTRSGRYSLEVTDSLFEFKKYPRFIYKQIRDSPLNEKKEYVYSDLSFILYPQVVKRLTGENFEDYLKETFYKPLGASTLTFNPRRFYSLDRIVPTEYDSLFRKTLIWGRVHDEGAAMLNGLSGHAGLFGSANDLMKVYEMYRQQGSYAGQQFISAKTMAEFTRYQFPELDNRRGLGFDKPSFTFTGNAPRSATKVSYGHSGFTGTFVWVEPDPNYNLTYVFLCNRVYPTRNNPKLGNLNTRTNIVEALYQATKRGLQ
jgi:beta-glucosidase-like glycosyl hydrolase/CubicO group peptidase (beta-lactamase class C family)